MIDMHVCQGLIEQLSFDVRYWRTGNDKDLEKDFEASATSASQSVAIMI